MWEGAGLELYADAAPASWEASYDGEAGGILTVKSELGEPIHKVANRGMRLWRDFDARYFSLPRDRRAAAIAADRDAIIAALNADYQKPYFGAPRPGGGAPLDVAHMTYAEVAARMAETMFVLPAAERPGVEPPHEEATPHGRWIDATYRDRLVAFLRRAEASSFTTLDICPATHDLIDSSGMAHTCRLCPGLACWSAWTCFASASAFALSSACSLLSRARCVSMSAGRSPSSSATRVFSAVPASPGS